MTKVTKEFAVMVFLNCLRVAHRRHYPASDFVIPDYNSLPMPARAVFIEAFDNYNQTLLKISEES